MIYRKWSLLTGPPAILGGIVVSIAVANYIFIKKDPPKERKVEPAKNEKIDEGSNFKVI